MEEKRCRTCKFNFSSYSPICRACGIDKKNWKAAVKWEIPKLKFDFDYSAIAKATKLIDPSEIIKKHITVDPWPWIINDKDESSLYPSLMETFGYCVNDVKNTEEMYKRMIAKKKIDVYKNKPEIERVIFNYPATIVLWTDGTKTIVKAQGDEVYDKEKGLAMAICKKLYGNTGRYFEEFKKWIPEAERKEEPKKDHKEEKKLSEMDE